MKDILWILGMFIIFLILTIIVGFISFLVGWFFNLSYIVYFTFIAICIIYSLGIFIYALAIKNKEVTKIERDAEKNLRQIMI